MFEELCSELSPLSREIPPPSEMFDLLPHVLQVLAVIDVVESLLFYSPLELRDFAGVGLRSDPFDDGVAAKFLKNGCLCRSDGLLMCQCSCGAKWLSKFC